MTKDELKIKEATIDDLQEIVFMLSDDELGSTREKYEIPLHSSYLSAFNKINNSKDAALLVGLINGDLVAVAQINLLHYLTFQGGSRAQIEGVRVKRAYQGKGIGRKLFEHMIEYAKAKGCHMVQLTTNNQRDDAQKFYESLGFSATHQGMKLYFE
jgi:ribosomal protein S18 acetylase RimI-like enzyme